MLDAQNDGQTLFIDKPKLVNIYMSKQTPFQNVYSVSDS